MPGCLRRASLEDTLQALGHQEHSSCVLGRWEGAPEQCSALAAYAQEP